MVAEVCAWGTDSAPAPHQMAWRRATGTLPEWRGVRATVNVLCENCPRWKLGPGGLYLEMVDTGMRRPTGLGRTTATTHATLVSAAGCPLAAPPILCTTIWATRSDP